ncbi:hypothetical protein, partial [Paenibacillus xylanexedens]|uniref:hypothetical protein n=1 Tax=Paenibacillus xylanexedens TaxID=528191 RepID=UPI001C92FD15
MFERLNGVMVIVDMCQLEMSVVERMVIEGVRMVVRSDEGRWSLKLFEGIKGSEWMGLDGFGEVF